VGQVFPPQVAFGGHVPWPLQVGFCGLQVSVAGQVGWPQVIWPGVVGSGQGIAAHVSASPQLGVGAIVGSQAASPGQVDPVYTVGHSEMPQVAT
jgi:hypothetical protein